jgi:hypothetical protein
VYIDTNAPNVNVNCAIGLDPAGSGGTATTIANEDEIPAGVVFTEPDAGSPLALGDLAPDGFYAIWIRRVVSPGASASSGDSLILGYTGGSDA